MIQGWDSRGGGGGGWLIPFRLGGAGDDYYLIIVFTCPFVFCSLMFLVLVSFLLK